MLYIRADMNREIATGHIMRCLAIADAARAAGEETTFLLADGEAAAPLTERGYPFLILNTAWNRMEEELEPLARILQERRVAGILVDSYQVTPSYLAALNQMVRVLYLDDLGRFPLPVDTLVCYALYWEKFHYQEHCPNVRLCLGPRYVPLRAEFSSLKAKTIRPCLENILILSGGSDPYNALDRIVQIVSARCDSTLEVVCGRYHPNYEQLRARYDGERVHIHHTLSNMAEWMRRADLAISAGGTTLYELCACGTPCISYAMADNQLDNVRAFEQAGMIDCVGDIRDAACWERLPELLDRCQSPERRAEKSERMRAIVDGNGAARIAETLIDISH